MSFVQKMPAIRTILETLSRGKVVKRRLPNGLHIYVSPDSQLKYLGTRFDRDLIEIAKRYVSERSVVWDVGANCGVFSFSSAKAREIVAIEADPFLANTIQRSMIINNIALTLVNAAASSGGGLEEFSIAKRGRASNHLSSVQGYSHTGGERARLLVSTITLDSLLLKVSPPTFIKIDVEGAEVAVLEGASRILSEARPTIYLETTDHTHLACKEILDKNAYRMEKGADLNWLCSPE